VNDHTYEQGIIDAIGYLTQVYEATERRRFSHRSEPNPPHHQAHLVDGPAPGHAERQGTGELNEPDDLANQCSSSSIGDRGGRGALLM